MADRGAAMGMKKLDRIFESNDVNILSLVQFIDHCGQSSRLTTASCTGYQHDPILFFDYRLKDGRQIQFRKRWHGWLQLTHDNGAPAVLFVNVCAEASDIVDCIVAIARTSRSVVGSQPLVVTYNIFGECVDEVRGEKGIRCVDGRRFQAPVYLNKWRFSREEEQVRDSLSGFQHAGDQSVNGLFVQSHAFP